MELTPETSYGFEVCEFADRVLGAPLDPWQEWLVIHAGELLADGRPRFRQLLILVSRQAGKTHLLVVLSLYWAFLEQVGLILGTSTNLDYARESWQKAVDMAEANEWLRGRIANVRRTNGEQQLVAHNGSRLKLAASNSKGGRSLTIARLIMDELREHKDWIAWNAAVPATNAVRDAQVWCLSNQGDDTAVVLDALRIPALSYIETAEGDERLGLFEWSAPDGSDPTDVQALAQANPNLGRRTELDTLLGPARRAKAAGGAELAGFLTEQLCMRVHQVDPAIDPDRWAACASAEPIDLAQHRDRLALALDVSLDGSHATLVGAALLDGVVHVEVIESWNGYGSSKQLRAELPDLVRKIRPRALGWFPQGPAASLAAELAARKGPQRGVWPPRGVELEELTSELSSVTMGFSEQVSAGDIAHPDDDVLNAAILAAMKLNRGDRWTFTRKNSGPIDAAYAAAGAVHLARTLPPPRSPLVVI